MTADLLRDAIAAWQRGADQQAAALVEQILAGPAPVPAGAFHLAGHMALARGDTAAGVARLAAAVAADPRHPVIANDLGAALRLADRLEEAEAAFGTAVALDPAYAQAWHNLGLTRRARGALPEAAAALERAAALQPAAATWMALGVVRLALDDHDAAAAALTHAVAAAPESPEAWFNLGLARTRRGAADAGAAFERALALKPDWAEAHSALGVSRAQRGDEAGARAAFERAAALAPENPRIMANLGSALMRDNDPRAISLLEGALARDPGNAETWFSLGVARHATGDAAGGRAAWQAALAHDAVHARARSALLMDAQYDDVPAGLLAAAKEWGRVHGDPPDRRTAWPNPRDPERRLRLGYVSPDLRDHAVAHFLLPLVDAHDRRGVELFAYADVRRPDAVTGDFRARFDHWRDILGLPDARVAQLVGEDGIDILVDLAGHTADNRLPMFARHPAPLQVSWLGYPATTGVPAIGWRLGDAITDPPGTSDTTEAVLRLARPFLCYMAPGTSPPADARARERLTFGCFNNARKITPRLVAAWARLLAARPDARLILKARGLVQPGVAGPIRAAFATAGIAASRIELRDWIDDMGAHLAAYAEIDIALDTAPYNGTTTTCEALWMGVPVVTLAGDRHASRVGASLLAAVGLPQLVAHDLDGYTAAALALAADATGRAALRRELRPRLQSSPLMDGAGFARAVEHAFRQLWRAWCRG